MDTFIEVLFWLIVAHAVCDYPLQGDFLARAKNRHDPINKPVSFWQWALPMHSAIHAGAVAIITGSILLGAIEFVLHNIIDYAKCEKWTGFNTDQVLHLVCKVGFALIVVTGVVEKGGS